MLEWIPDGVIEELGDEYSTMTDTGVNFEPSDVFNVFEALAREGVACAYDEDLDDLFTGSY
jgi:hypothetical protein